ncbi:hypothetical protein BDZ45DRAFT_16991 [Acephala macrosclerotiorum]|nr:hypothetical protein BDZ45DRAFT_16991 [Acephala macrosclerotiorum]
MFCRVRVRNSFRDSRTSILRHSTRRLVSTSPDQDASSNETSEPSFRVRRLAKSSAQHRRAMNSIKAYRRLPAEESYQISLSLSSKSAEQFRSLSLQYWPKSHAEQPVLSRYLNLILISRLPCHNVNQLDAYDSALTTISRNFSGFEIGNASPLISRENGRIYIYPGYSSHYQAIYDKLIDALRRARIPFAETDSDDLQSVHPPHLPLFGGVPALAADETLDVLQSLHKDFPLGLKFGAVSALSFWSPCKEKPEKPGTFGRQIIKVYPFQGNTVYEKIRRIQLS